MELALGGAERVELAVPVRVPLAEAPTEIVEVGESVAVTEGDIVI